MTEIKRIGPDDERYFDLFFRLAEEVYENDPVWAGESRHMVLHSAMNSEKQNGPWFRAYVAVEDDRPLARGSATFDLRAGGKEGPNIGFIGHFEARENEIGAVLDLFNVMESDLREKGVEKVIAPRSGPMDIGLQIDRFDMPQTWKTPHNPPYYPDYLEKAGYGKKEDLLTFIMDMDTDVERYPDVLGIRVRTIDLREFDREMVIFNELNNEIFGDHDNFIPRTLEEDRILITSILPLLDRDMVLFAQTDEGRPIGLLVAVPDHVQRAKGKPMDRVRLISVGLVPEYTGIGIAPMMGKRLKEVMKRKGYRELEGSWVVESNQPPIKGARKLGATPGRRFRIYEKVL